MNFFPGISRLTVLGKIYSERMLMAIMEDIQSFIRVSDEPVIRKIIPVCNSIQKYCFIVSVSLFLLLFYSGFGPNFPPFSGLSTGVMCPRPASLAR